MAKNSKASKRRRRNLAKSNRSKRNKRAVHTVAYDLLEPKQLLAAVTVSNATDVLSPTANTSSITALIGNDGGDGISLREAIAAANNTAGEDSVTFDGSVFTGEGNNVIRLIQGELEISDSLSIDGTSVGGVLITGDRLGNDSIVSGTNITNVSESLYTNANSLDDNSRVLNFSVYNGNLTLSGLTITGGRTTADGFNGGGGIRFSSGDVLDLNDSTVSGNSTTGSNAYGGGIYATSGSVLLADSTVNDNITTGNNADGGGIFTTAGEIYLGNSTVSGNRTTEDTSAGGGIFTFVGEVRLVDSAVSDNRKRRWWWWDLYE